MKIHCPICREPVETKREAVGYVSYCGCEVPGQIEGLASAAIIQHVYNRAMDAVFPTDQEAA